jgi:hypothetical protein
MTPARPYWRQIAAERMQMASATFLGWFCAIMIRGDQLSGIGCFLTFLGYCQHDGSAPQPYPSANDNEGFR